MPVCNGPDRGEMPRRESVLTSVWSLIARSSVEPKRPAGGAIPLGESCASGLLRDFFISR